MTETSMTEDLQLVPDKKAAEILDVSLMTVHRWTKSGILPPKVKIGPRLTRHRLKDIKSLIDKR
jgi:predicted DNA-binding transcriptional regulator AlpA